MPARGSSWIPRSAASEVLRDAPRLAAVESAAGSRGRGRSRRHPGLERFLGLLLAMLLGLLAAGCGYTLVGRGGSNIPEDVERIQVQTLENGTQRAQVEQILTRAIVDELVTRRRFEVVNDAAGADAVLSGRVVSFNLRPVSFDTTGLADSFEVEVTADMVFQRTPAAGERPEDAEVLWRNSRYLFRQDYPVEQAGLDFLDRELQAIEETSERFAETLVIDILEGF